jgi:hypothetical protein
VRSELYDATQDVEHSHLSYSASFVVFDFFL